MPILSFACHGRYPGLLFKMIAMLTFFFFGFSGSKLSMGSIFGVSVVFGSINLWPHFVYAMDGEHKPLAKTFCS